MKIYCVYIYLVIALFATGCVKNKNVNNKDEIVNININPDVVNDNYDFAEDVDFQIDIVALETTDDSLIGGVFKIIYKNEQYYILDKITKKILVFNKEGKFMSSLNKIGSGPDEYIDIQDFTVIDNNIWIIDNRIKKLICYNDNNEMLKAIKLKSWAYNIISNDSEIFLANNWISRNKTDYQLAIYDLKKEGFDQVFSFDALPGNIIHKSMRKQIAYSNSSYLFAYSYKDTLYEVKDKNIYPRYAYQFSNRYKNEIEGSSVAKKPGIIYGLLEFYQTANSVILLYIDDKKTRYVIYDKKGNKVSIFNKLINSSLGGMSFFCDSFDDNELISVSEAPTLLYYCNEKQILKNISEPYKEKIESIMKDLTEESNPVIFRFKLKKESNL